MIKFSFFNVQPFFFSPEEKKKVLLGLSKKSLSHVTVWIHLLQLKKVKLILIKLLKIKLPTVLQLFIKWSKKKKYIYIYIYIDIKIKGMFGNCFFPLIFCFQKQFSIFETKKFIWQPKMNRKQKLFSKLNLWRKLKTCKMLFSISNF